MKEEKREEVEMAVEALVVGGTAVEALEVEEMAVVQLERGSRRRWAEEAEEARAPRS